MNFSRIQFSIMMSIFVLSSISFTQECNSPVCLSLDNVDLTNNTLEVNIFNQAGCNSCDLQGGCAYCSDNSFDNQSDCEAASETWGFNAEPDGYCLGACKVYTITDGSLGDFTLSTSIVTETSCVNAGSCTDGTTTDSDDCNDAGSCYLCSDGSSCVSNCF